MIGSNTRIAFKKPTRNFTSIRYFDPLPITFRHMAELWNKYVPEMSNSDAVYFYTFNGKKNPTVSNVYTPAFFGICDNLGVIRAAMAGNKVSEKAYVAYGPFVCKRKTHDAKKLITKLIGAHKKKALENGAQFFFISLYKGSNYNEIIESLAPIKIKKLPDCTHYLFNLKVA